MSTNISNVVKPQKFVLTELNEIEIKTRFSHMYL